MREQFRCEQCGELYKAEMEASKQMLKAAKSPAPGMTTAQLSEFLAILDMSGAYTKPKITKPGIGKTGFERRLAYKKRRAAKKLVGGPTPEEIEVATRALESGISVRRPRLV